MRWVRSHYTDFSMGKFSLEVLSVFVGVGLHSEWLVFAGMGMIFLDMVTTDLQFQYCMPDNLDDI